MSTNIIEKLKNDADYYGDFGKQFLSNSDIGDLLNNPMYFKKNTETTKAMIEGSYFHTAVLEPEKLGNFNIVDASSRNTNIYKDAVKESGSNILILRSEVDELNNLVNTMKGNLHFYDNIYKDGNQFEVPNVKEIYGAIWKGKADIVTDEMIIDIKTTSSISDFRYSAKKYNYDSQAYLYQEFFGKPLVFYVIDKATGMLGEFNCSDDFLESGRVKVISAIDQYNKFFGKDAWADINNYIIEEEL
jgi:hypothetical protein